MYVKNLLTKDFDNAVAPDWNLKFYHAISIFVSVSNAVAPDWNLKSFIEKNKDGSTLNAVAPDWNLKYR